MKQYLHDNLTGTLNKGRKVKDQKKESQSFQLKMGNYRALAETRCSTQSLQGAFEIAGKINESVFIVYVSHQHFLLWSLVFLLHALHFCLQ